MRSRVQSVTLVGVVVVIATTLILWKVASIRDADAAAAAQPEAVESIAVTVASERRHNSVTTSIGTVVARRSISVRNEVPGTVRVAALQPGAIVEAGAILIALDVSVEQAELKALEAQAELARTQLERMQHMVRSRAASVMEVDAAQTERDVALAQIARAKAVIERKTIRAPFRARVGISDVHPGQYLNEGTTLTTLQGIDEYAYVDFTVSQQVAAELHPSDRISVVSGADEKIAAEILALDARVDPATRNAMVRARLPDEQGSLTPGSSVRVEVPFGEPRIAVAIPASAVRKGPEGEHVFVLVADSAGNHRVRQRQVRVDAMAGDEALIESGLSAGEKVAAAGSFKLRHEALVNIIENPAASALNLAQKSALKPDISL